MLKVQGLRVLAVPAAVSLAGLLVVACMERDPTAPDGANAPSLAGAKSGLYDDPKASRSCSGNDLALVDPDPFYTANAGVDVNGNGVICMKTTGGGGKHK